MISTRWSGRARTKRMRSSRRGTGGRGGRRGGGGGPEARAAKRSETVMTAGTMREVSDIQPQRFLAAPRTPVAVPSS